MTRIERDDDGPIDFARFNLGELRVAPAMSFPLNRHW